MMKKILFVVLVFFASTFTAGAQKQEGYVRTLEKANRPSQGIEGVSVDILEYPNALVTKKGGKFSFSLQGKKQGDAFKVSRVQKKGYTLVDKYLTGRKYSYSSSVPIEIVMVSDKQLAANKKMIEDKAYAKAKKNYEARVAELERQLAEKTISEQTYRDECERLSNNHGSYIKLIGEMAERYAMTDYSGLSDLNREIMECIENAELERADSLINSKGDFDKREQELRAQMEFNDSTAKLLIISQQDVEIKRNDLAQDYYNKHTIHADNYLNDSAAYYLIKRAALDTANLDWQRDAGFFIQNFLADYELAMKYYQRGLSQAIAQYGEQSDKTADYYDDIGSIYDFQQNFSQALAYYQKALAIRESVLGTEHPDVAESLDDIGLIYDNQGDYTQAFEYFQKALAIRERVLGLDEPDVAESYYHIGNYFSDRGDFALALDYHQKALAIRERALRAEDPEIAESINSIGGVYYAQGDYPKASEYAQKALAIREKVFGLNHPGVAASYENIGRLYLKMEDRTKCVEYLTKALNIYLKVLGPGHEVSQRLKMVIEYLK